ncbi:hypothetical protein D3C76_1583110 [compost metagenome]
MAAGEDHHPEGENANRQPQRAVIVGDHHIVTEHPPAHHRDPHQQGDNRLPAKTFHGGNGRFLLAFTAFEVIFNCLCTVARFFNGLH